MAAKEKVCAASTRTSSSKYARLTKEVKLHLEELWLVDGLSILDMEDITGYTSKTIRTYFQKVFGKDALHERSRRVHSLAIVGKKHPQYNGGKKKHADGYAYVLQPYADRTQRYVLEHRLVMNCPADKIVHHCDGVKDNNEVSNLVVMSTEQHSALHAAMGSGYWNKDKVINWLKTFN